VQELKPRLVGLIVPWRLQLAAFKVIQMYMLKSLNLRARTNDEPVPKPTSSTVLSRKMIPAR
jgi:hypothetical protein